MPVRLMNRIENGVLRAQALECADRIRNRARWVAIRRDLTLSELLLTLADELTAGEITLEEAQSDYAKYTPRIERLRTKMGPD